MEPAIETSSIGTNDLKLLNSSHDTKKSFHLHLATVGIDNVHNDTMNDRRNDDHGNIDQSSMSQHLTALNLSNNHHIKLS